MKIFTLLCESSVSSIYDRNKHNGFFFQIDMNHDGVVQIDELQQYMGNYLRPSMAKFIAKQIHSKYDVNSDGKLNFEEFYEMSLRKEYKFHRLLFKYCRYVVPPRTQDEDSLGNHLVFISLSHKVNCVEPSTLISFHVFLKNRPNV